MSDTAREGVISERACEGLMMDDFPLSLRAVIERAETLSFRRPVVFRRPDGSIHRTTLGECAARARRLAAGLAALGIGAGERVATMLWNQPEHLEAYLAIPPMGAVIHTLNPRLHTDELSFIAADAADRAIIVDETLLDVFEALRAEWQFEHVIVVSHSGSAPDAALEYESLTSAHEPMDWPEIGERRAAAMCYTSGTTGRPKGVLYSHRSVVLHSLVTALPDTMGVSTHDVILPVVPMFHANAWGLPYAAAFAGAALVLPGPRLDAESVLDLLAGERVTVTAGVPTVWMSVLQAIEEQPDRWDLSALKRMIVGGSAVPRSLLEGFDRHGLTILQAWGMTETSPLGSMCRVPPELDSASTEDRYDFRARQGIAVPFIELRARGDDGELIPWNDQAMGELEVRGPWVAAGYHGGAGQEKFTDDGWFQTGDVVRIDEHGCIRITDRAKDLVKSGGEWISSVDLENLLMAHPAVAEAAVIAIPDERWGERPLAAIVLREGQEASPDDLRQHLTGQFAKWQIPERIEFIEEIPRTATGKFKKTELRERFVQAVAR
ncbi:MAG: long-chain-fatty-acid--CoA ligase [Solirubrobacterales bacterium]|nr:long-chain-fatty-acid--CoA ligase [Solirubrobacterales bacterium]MBV9714491.1 long-chain-fatty-acid--CoA ligase [Solirubrobacterales bacterium]